MLPTATPTAIPEIDSTTSTCHPTPTSPPFATAVYWPNVTNMLNLDKQSAEMKHATDVHHIQGERVTIKHFIGRQYIK
jgi:hypothetical protein